MDTGALPGDPDVGTWVGGAVVAGADDVGDVGGVLLTRLPDPGVGLWCEVSTTAAPALRPATTTTLAAASAGAQPRRQVPPRRARGDLARLDRVWPAVLARRNATSSTVTRRGGSGAAR